MKSVAELTIQTRSEGAVTVITVTGNLDVFSAPQLDKTFRDLAGRGTTRMVVDVAGSPFIGSAGWGVFLTNLKELKKRGGELVLSGLDSQARRIYEVFGLQDFLKIYPDPGAAARAVQGP